MNKQEALTRIKTGNFNGDYGFDMQLLIDTVGIIGEMFKSGQISETATIMKEQKVVEPIYNEEKFGDFLPIALYVKKFYQAYRNTENQIFAIDVGRS